MIRLTGGEFRGRYIKTPPHSRTRPTQSRLRQALFNSIQGKIPEAKVLDLFAGSGALGFEALSRGASFVVFVESGKSVAQLIQKNAFDLKVTEKTQVIHEFVQQAWGLVEKMGPFDLVLADPPYAGHWETELLEQAPWNQLLRPEGLFCLEWGGKINLPEKSRFLVKIREKNYGDSMLTTFALSLGELP